MKAELKSWYCPDIDDLSIYSPECSDNFNFLFRAIVGPMDSESRESFDIQVCTPKWFLSNMKVDEIIIGRHFLIVREYNYDRIVTKLKKLIESCHGKTWDEIAEKVGRIGFWEFEDYVE